MLGELNTYLVFSQGEGENYRLPDNQARKAAAGWGGDMLTVYTHDATQKKAMHTAAAGIRPRTPMNSGRRCRITARRVGAHPVKAEPGKWSWDQTPDGSVLIKRSGKTFCG